MRTVAAWGQRQVLAALQAGLVTAAALAATAVAGAGPGPSATGGSTGSSNSGDNITGTWASTTGAERLIFLPGGYFRTCYAGGRQGNAAMGQWKRLGPGRFTVEFTHTARPDCRAPPQTIRQHPSSIVGEVLISKGELALYVSGEFPPDIYRPAPNASGLK